MTDVKLDLTRDENLFYQKHFDKLIIALGISFFLVLCFVTLLLFQIHNKPLPLFVAVSAGREKLVLKPYEVPNLMPNTLITWASKAAVRAYSYDFYNYPAQLEAVRPYFTEAGWANYKNSLQGLINTITANKLFVNGIVSGPPVISNEGELGGYEKVWRVQIPFLVTYQSAETTTSSSYMVTLMIVKVPTTQNYAAIAIDQFVMR